MGLFSPFRGRRDIDSHGPRGPSSSFDHTIQRRPSGRNQRPPKDAPIRDFDPDRPANGSRKASDPPRSRTSYQSPDQDTIEVIHRKANDLYKDSLYDITLDTATAYPCTQQDLDASGGVNRRTAKDAYKLTDKTKWFAHPNNGPFIDARIAAREVFDHNDLNRIPSAAENKAIRRLTTSFRKASQGHWGPDLAIKAFCDLDKVFFCGRLRGHVCLTWAIDRSFEDPCYATTYYLQEGKCVIQLNAERNFSPLAEDSGFRQMWATLLHEACHAYQKIRALRLGPTGWHEGKPGGHGKNFGTMLLAVNRRFWELLGIEGDLEPYPLHDYAHDDNPRPAPKQPPPNIPPPRSPNRRPASPNSGHEPHDHAPPSRNPKRPIVSPESRRELHDDAFKDVTIDSGTDYPCTQSDLEATGGLARQAYPKDEVKDRSPSRRKWFSEPNHGPLVSPRQACLDIFQHNDLRRKPGKMEREAIGRVSEAIATWRNRSWGPDLIIKAFCDLDIIFFGGRLRGHVCVRWLPDWSPAGHTLWGTTVFLGEGKCAIRLNADTILLDDDRPFECMFATILHEMCHADAHTRVLERMMLKCGSHGKAFGTRYYAVEKRAQKLFGLTLKGYPGESYPRHKYEKGEGLP